MIEKQYRLESLEGKEEVRGCIKEPVMQTDRVLIGGNELPDHPSEIADSILSGRAFDLGGL